MSRESLANPKLASIPYEKLDFNPDFNYREKSGYAETDARIQKLMEDILKQGLKTRLEVVEQDGTYIGLRGFRRFTAIGFLRKKYPNMFPTVECLVYKDLTPLEIELHRADHGLVVGLNKREQYNAVVKLAIAGASEQQIGDTFGQSRGWAMTRVHVYKLSIFCPEVEKAYLGEFAENETPFSVPNKVVDGSGDVPGLFKILTEADGKTDAEKQNAVVEAWEKVKHEILTNGGKARKTKAMSTNDIKDMRDKAKSQPFRFILSVVLGEMDRGDVQKWDEMVLLKCGDGTAPKGAKVPAANKEAAKA